jgi:predicted nuclease of predicted toxin-antitoxin system
VTEWEGRLAEQRSTVRLLIDENLPASLKRHLADLFPGSIHVSDISLTSSSDCSIWEYAKAFGFAILTKDNDFAARSRSEGGPPVVIQIRAGNSSAAKLVSLLRENGAQIMTAVQFGGPLLEIGFSRLAGATDSTDPSQG